MVAATDQRNFVFFSLPKNLLSSEKWGQCHITLQIYKHYFWSFSKLNISTLCCYSTWTCHCEYRFVEFCSTDPKCLLRLRMNLPAKKCPCLGSFSQLLNFKKIIEDSIKSFCYNVRDKALLALTKPCATDSQYFFSLIALISDN